ncbi:type 4a pilus biogenesis protein PilO [Acinetobacter sp. ESL0695]|uniref:type 4a pilus biogenesis protein PilO n=1 Tax=Acinetobacter sp. ESL0695 TaxID=2983215 RepID=UPI0023F19F78|nr:type 4a pilus biogenesis protein PilO [Acinetobacter sp. ESL0695]WEV49172.1 type 4a pilus biogenesis protein PilO [Acinetobacter sp. ESL0695]
MSQENDLNDVSTQPPKSKMTLKKFTQQFNSLDPNNYGSWPIIVKFTCWLFITFVICVVGYFVLVSSVIDQISTARAQEENLLNEYRQKESTLRNLERYEQQLKTMQDSFNEQLQQLPKESEIPGLVEDINVTGVESGLKFKNIRLDPEIRQNFFLEQPISIEATGDFHAFGQFASDIALLPRIVTLQDFSITAQPNSNKKSEIPELSYIVNAKTYRYLGNELSSLGSQPNSSTGAK